MGLHIENTKKQTLLHIKSISCGQMICLKKFSPLCLWELLKHNDRKYSVNLDAWLAELMGLLVVGFMASEKIFLVFPHFKSIEAYDSMASIDTMSLDGRIYVGDHKTYFYKLWVSPFQRRFLKFFP